MGGVSNDISRRALGFFNLLPVLFFFAISCAEIGAQSRQPSVYGPRPANNQYRTRRGRLEVLQPRGQLGSRVIPAGAVQQQPQLGQPMPNQPNPTQPNPSQIQQVQPRTQIPPTTQQEPRRLPLLAGPSTELGTPTNDPKVTQEYGRFIERTIDPEVTFNLIVGQPRILEFKQTPTRIYLAQESVASYDVISDTEIAIVGVAPGRTVLTIWVDDPDRPGKQRVLSYLLQVGEDSEFRVKLEAVFKALEKEINRDFPDSFVKLSLIGDQVVVRGQAKDVIEAAQILRIIREHAPPSRNDDNDANPTNVSISQTSYSPNGLQGEEFGLTLDRLSAVAGLDGDSNVINLLSIPGEQQVMLRVTVAEVNRSALRTIGTNMRIGGDSGVGFRSVFPPRIDELADATLMILEGGTFSVARGDFRLTVDALKEHNLARTLAEPNLVTLHGRPASFQAGGQFPVPAGVVGFGSAAQGVNFIPFGVQLQFVPFIVDRDKIRLNVAANVSTRDEALSTDVAGSNVPGLNTRNFQNSVELREGQTLAVAGLIQTNFGALSSRVPGLGDLPWIGRLFKSDGTSADEQELIILITPELVHPVDKEGCKPVPGSDMIEPSDIEFYLKGLIEGRRTQDFRSPVRTDWAKLKRYHYCEDIFIVGPNGHCYGRNESGSHLRAAAPDSPFKRWPSNEVLSSPIPVRGQQTK